MSTDILLFGCDFIRDMAVNIYRNFQHSSTMFMNFFHLSQKQLTPMFLFRTYVRRLRSVAPPVTVFLLDVFLQLIQSAHTSTSLETYVSIYVTLKNNRCFIISMSPLLFVISLRSWRFHNWPLN